MQSQVQFNKILDALRGREKQLVIDQDDTYQCDGITYTVIDDGYTHVIQAPGLDVVETAGRPLLFREGDATLLRSLASRF